MPVLLYISTLISALRFSRSFTSASKYLTGGAVAANSVDKFHKQVNDFAVDEIANLDTLREDFTQLRPSVKDTAQISVSNPSTLPDYMLQNNELIGALLEQQKNTSKQLEHQNVLNVELLKVHSESRVFAETISKTLNASLPALVIQLQEVAKIAGVISIKTDTETAYSEQSLTNHSELISTLQNLDLAPGVVNVTNEVPSPSVNVTNDVSIPNQDEAITALTNATIAQKNALVSELQAMNLTAFYEDGVLNVTNEVSTPSVTIQNDNVAIQDLKTATQNHTAELVKVRDYLGLVSENAVKQKEIADYQTTAVAIKNLDGNTVATAKPMEVQAIKNVVDAKNATDEMEFELDDTILNGIFDALVLPEFTTTNFFANMEEIRNEDLLNG